MSRLLTFQDVVRNVDRVALTGWPRTGKTTLSKHVHDRDIIHTDDFMDLHWDDVPDAIMDACYEDRFLVEGVQVARALRRGLEVDCVVFLTHPVEPLSPAQDAMGRGVRTIFDEWAAATNTPIVYL